MIEFSARHLDRWPNIYRTSLCFVAATVPELAGLEFPGKDERVCRRARAMLAG